MWSLKFILVKPQFTHWPFLLLFLVTVDEPLDDIANEHHRNFMKDYRRDWPYPPWIHYKVGQIINAERNGVQQRCVVEAVDSSLIQVLFQVSIFNWIPCVFYSYMLLWINSSLCVTILRKINTKTGSTVDQHAWNTLLSWGRIHRWKHCQNKSTQVNGNMDF